MTLPATMIFSTHPYLGTWEESASTNYRLRIFEKGEKWQGNNNQLCVKNNLTCTPQDNVPGNAFNKNDRCQNTFLVEKPYMVL